MPGIPMGEILRAIQQKLPFAEKGMLSGKRFMPQRGIASMDPGVADREIASQIAMKQALAREAPSQQWLMPEVANPEGRSLMPTAEQAGMPRPEAMLDNYVSAKTAGYGAMQGPGGEGFHSPDWGGEGPKGAEWLFRPDEDPALTGYPVASEAEARDVNLPLRMEEAAFGPPDQPEVDLYGIPKDPVLEIQDFLDALDAKQRVKEEKWQMAEIGSMVDRYKGGY